MRIPQGARSVRTGGDKDGREDKARNEVDSEGGSAGGSAQNLLRRGRAPKPGGKERAPETLGGVLGSRKSLWEVGRLQPLGGAARRLWRWKGVRWGNGGASQVGEP